MKNRVSKGRTGRTRKQTAAAKRCLAGARAAKKNTGVLQEAMTVEALIAVAEQPTEEDPSWNLE